MAFFSVKEIPRGRRGSHSLDKWRREYVRAFACVTDSMADGAQQAVAAVLATYFIPLGSQYVTGNEVDLGALLIKYDADQDDENPFLWIVKAMFDSQVGSALDQKDQNPLLRPVRWAWKGQRAEVPMEKDIDGKAVVNGAQDPFDPPVIRRNDTAILTATRNESNPDLAKMRSFKNVYNTDDFFGFPPKNWLTGEFEIEGPESENNVTFYKTLYTFELAQEGETWDVISVMNKGHNYWEYLSPHVLAKTAVSSEIDGRSLNGQTLLDSNGFRIAKDAPPQYIDFKRHRGQAYADLGLN